METFLWVMPYSLTAPTAKTEVNTGKYAMNKSVLGDDLEIEREKAFMARFGRILSQKEKLNPKDARYIRSLTRKLATAGGSFSPSIDQSTWLNDIDARLSLPSNQTEETKDKKIMIDKLIPRAEGIIRNGSLTPFRLENLIRIVDTYEREGTLSRNDLDTLQFLVLEGLGYPED